MIRKGTAYFVTGFLLGCILIAIAVDASAGILPGGLPAPVESEFCE